MNVRIPPAHRAAWLAPALFAVILTGCSGGTGDSARSDDVREFVSTGPLLAIEQPQLTIGFVKLTDMAPLAIAYEKGFFVDEGLSVTLEPQSNWKVLLDRVIDGQLDGAQMLAGQPLAAAVGFGTAADIVTAFGMGLNGNATTVSNEVWGLMRSSLAVDAQGRPAHPIRAQALQPAIDAFRSRGQAFHLAMVFPVSTHNFELRYWLAAGGVHPGYYAPGDVSGQIGADVLLSVTPPPQMPATLEAGTIHGYSAGEPWNQQAVVRGIGVPVVTDYEIWKNNPEKVFGVTRAWAEAHPNTHVAIVKALIRASAWLDADGGANRREAARIISRSAYVGADERVLSAGLTGAFEYERGDIRSVPEFNVFFRHHATFPYYSDAIWFLTQMRRWGQIPDGHPDQWYRDTAARVYLPDVHRRAASMLVEAGLFSRDDFPFDSDGFRPSTADFIDGVTYDGRTPNAYLDSLAIGLKGDEHAASAAAGLTN